MWNNFDVVGMTNEDNIWIWVYGRCWCSHCANLYPWKVRDSRVGITVEIQCRKRTIPVEVEVSDKWTWIIHHAVRAACLYPTMGWIKEPPHHNVRDGLYQSRRLNHADTVVSWKICQGEACCINAIPFQTVHIFHIYALWAFVYSDRESNKNLLVLLQDSRDFHRYRL